MRIKAATVEQHSFSVRRRGYDRTEVDAVMGQVGHSLRGYEEEIDDLEARLIEAQRASIAINASFATMQRAREELMEQTRMESAEMMKQAEETLAKARREAESILAATRAEIERLFSGLTKDTQEVLGVAEREAADHKAKAEEAASQIVAGANADAEKLRSTAESVKAEADEARQRAAAEAEELRRAAARDADAMVEQARAEHDRLSARIPELRNALSKFEAQVQALTSTSVIDLNELEEAEARTEEVAGPVEEQAVPAAGQSAGEKTASAAVEQGVPAPDGSGTLPAARDLVDLDEYRELKGPGHDEDDAEEEAVIEAEETAEEPEPAPEPVAAAASSTPFERLASSHVASRTIGSDTTETIYQRRGGGLRRRIKAQGDD